MNGNFQILGATASSHPGWKCFILSAVLLLLFARITGTFPFSRLSSASFLPLETVQSLPADSDPCFTREGLSASEAKKLAMAYYAKKYHDSYVDIDVIPKGDHMEADVRKNGELVKWLSIKDGTVTEHRTGLRDWSYNLLYMMN